MPQIPGIATIDTPEEPFTEGCEMPPEIDMKEVIEFPHGPAYLGMVTVKLTCTYCFVVGQWKLLANEAA